MARSKIYIGNSVSTFSALHMLHRKFLGQPYILYNSGGIPLENSMFNFAEIARPHNKLKWVFTFGTEYENEFPMIKASVLSAQRNSDILIYCVFDGKESDMTKWLQSHNVVVIFHTFKLKSHLQSKFRDLGFDSLKVLEIIKYFAFLDIPLLGFTDEYILISDSNVLFRKNINLNDFVSLPKFVACGPHLELSSESVCDTSLLLINTRAMASEYEKYSSSLSNYRFEINNLDSVSDYYFFQLFLLSYFKQYLVYFDSSLSWKPFYSGWKEYDPKIIHFLGARIEDFKKFYSGQVIQPIYLPYFKKCYLPNSSCQTVYNLFLASSQD